jgi:hypothetical protein
MSKAKEELKNLIEDQPEDSSCEEIVREISWTAEAQRWLEGIFEYIAADNPGPRLLRRLWACHIALCA